MMTNNTCDIEKDREAKRKTLPALLGRSRARALYHALMYLWVIAIIVLVLVFYSTGGLVIPFMLLGCIPLKKALLQNPLVAKARVGAMAQVCGLNIALGSFYAAAIFASGMSLIW